MKLHLEPRLARADDIYATLVGLHDGMSREAGERAMSRLILILAHHIGDAEIVEEAIRVARAADSGLHQP